MLIKKSRYVVGGYVVLAHCYFVVCLPLLNSIVTKKTQQVLFISLLAKNKMGVAMNFILGANSVL